MWKWKMKLFKRSLQNQNDCQSWQKKFFLSWTKCQTPGMMIFFWLWKSGKNSMAKNFLILRVEKLWCCLKFFSFHEKTTSRESEQRFRMMKNGSCLLLGKLPKNERSISECGNWLCKKWPKQKSIHRLFPLLCKQCHFIANNCKNELAKKLLFPILSLLTINIYFLLWKTPSNFVVSRHSLFSLKRKSKNHKHSWNLKQRQKLEKLHHLFLNHNSMKETTIAKLYTIKEVVDWKLLWYKARSIREFIKKGELGFVDISPKWSIRRIIRIPESEIEIFLKKRAS